MTCPCCSLKGLGVTIPEWTTTSTAGPSPADQTMLVTNSISVTWWKKGHLEAHTPPLHFNHCLLLSARVTRSFFAHCWAYPLMSTSLSSHKTPAAHFHRTHHTFHPHPSASTASSAYRSLFLSKASSMETSHGTVSSTIRT